MTAPPPGWDGSYRPVRWIPQPWPTAGATQTLARFAAITLALVALSDIWVIGAVWLQRQRTYDVEDAASAADVRHALDGVDSADSAASVASGVNAVLILLCAGLFISWLYRAASDAQIFSPDSVRRGRGWAIGGWFVPILNLWVPYQMTCDSYIAAARRPERGRGDTAPLGPLRWWWGLWLAANVGNVISSLGDTDDLESFRSWATVKIGATLVEVAAAMLAIAVVVQVTRAHVRRAQAPPAPPPGPNGPFSAFPPPGYPGAPLFAGPPPVPPAPYGLPPFAPPGSSANPG